MTVIRAMSEGQREILTRQMVIFAMFFDVEGTWVQRPLLPKRPELARRQDFGAEAADGIRDELSDDRPLSSHTVSKQTLDAQNAGNVRDGDLRVAQTEKHVQSCADGREQQTQDPCSNRTRW